MELVLGLATLATAISGVAGAGHYDNTSPEIVEAEPKTVQTVSETTRLHGINNDLDFPKSNIGDLDASIAKSLPIDEMQDPYPESRNNTFEEATEVGIYNYDFSSYQNGQKPLSYRKSFEGRIGLKEDVDCYKFTIYGKAKVTITLDDIPTKCDYDLKLFEQGTGRFFEAQCINLVGRSTNYSNYSERIERLLYPNTYYIQVYSFCGDYGSSPYNLGLDVEYQRGEDLIISDLKNIGSKGALWLSDWDPYGIKPSISDSRTPIGSVGNYYRQYSRTESERGNFDTTHFTFPIQTGVYKHAELYIWDDSLRTQMLKFVSQLHDAVKAQVKTEQEMQISTKIEELATGTFISILGFIKGAGTVISIIQIAHDLGKGIYEIVCPPEDMVVKKTNFLKYLARLKEALSWYYPKGDTRALRIPMRYSVIKKVNETRAYPSSLYPLGSEVHSTNYYLTYQPVDEDETFEYKKSKIYVQDSENPFTGSIFPIADGDSISLALNQRQVSPLPTAQSLSLEQTSTVNLNYDGYKWFKFTAPLEGTQTYRFESAGNSEAECDVFTNIVYNNYDGHHGSNRIAYVQHESGVNNRDFAYEFQLEQGHSLYFRVHGTAFGYTVVDGWRYAPVWGSVVRFTRPTQSSTLSFEATDLGLGYHYGDPIMNTNFMQDNNITIDSAVGVQLGANRVMMHVDMDGDYPVTHFALNFHREIRSISFNAYKDPMRNECALFLKGYDQCGDLSYDDYLYGIETDLEWDQTFTYTFDQAEVYCFEFMFDPANDPISYWQRKETVYLGNFVVEFKD